MADELDISRPIIMARAVPVNGHDLLKGEAIRIVPDPSDERAQLTAKQAEHLFAGGYLIYADRAVATPVETPEQYAERATEVDQLDEDTFLIRAPWLGEGEEVSAEKLLERKQEVIDEGAQAHRDLINDLGPDAAAAVVTGADGFSLEPQPGGYFVINGPGLDEPLRVRGRQAAEDKLAELRVAAAAEQPDTSGDQITDAGTAEVSETAGEQGGQAVTDAAPPVVSAPTE